MKLRTHGRRFAVEQLEDRLLPSSTLWEAPAGLSLPPELSAAKVVDAPQPAAAGRSSHGRSAEHDVPFSASVTLTVAVQIPISAEPLVILAPGSASGHATHMGQVTGSFVSYIDVSTLGITGMVALWAADGDMLLLTFRGQDVPTATPGLFTFHGTYTLLGGTGRFAGVTGGGTIQGVDDIPGDVFRGTLSGTMTKP